MNKLLVVAVALALTGCLGTAPVEEQHGGNNAPKPDSPLPTTTVDMAGTDDAGNCGAMEFALTRVAPNVMLVADRSGSMNQAIASGSATSKWTDLKNAVSTLVTNYDAQMRL